MFNKENAFQNVIWKMVSPLLQPQCVNLHFSEDVESLHVGDIDSDCGDWVVSSQIKPNYCCLWFAQMLHYTSLQISLHHDPVSRLLPLMHNNRFMVYYNGVKAVVYYFLRPVY